jgi:hypothetical protein
MATDEVRFAKGRGKGKKGEATGAVKREGSRLARGKGRGTKGRGRRLRRENVRKSKGWVSGRERTYELLVACDEFRTASREGERRRTS